MITSVETVLIGKKCPASYTTADALAVGDVALFNENKQIIATAAEAAKASALFIGIAQPKVKVTMPNGSVVDKANIEFSNVIKKDSKPSMVVGEYSAPVEDKVEINLASATIVAGHRYVIRIVYRDIIEAPGQFTHTYEVVAASENAADLVAAFAKKINKHSNRRVNATVDSSKLTLIAMPKDDNEGVDSITEYTTVSMEATLYKTIPSALISNFPDKVPGAVVTKTQGNPGKGYWKQVRDLEKHMQGYKGFKFTAAYPEVNSKLQVVEGATYDYVIVENQNLYLSNDNQYIKNTPLRTTVFVQAGTLVGSVVENGIKAFITGSAE